jgi:hypothetical protein
MDKAALTVGLAACQTGLELFRTLRSWDHDVVVVGRKINLGYWEFGMGRESGGVEKGEVSSRVIWDQGGWDPITPRGFAP